MKKLAIWITFGAANLLALAGCDSESSLAGEGEVCAKTADCTGDLRCVDQICVGAGDSDTDSDAGEPEDRSDEIYDPNTVIQVEIEMDPVDWDTVRNDTRDLSCLESGPCNAEPCYSTYVWKSATVTLEGEVIENVGIRKKGMSSTTPAKPSLKLKFDKTIEGRHPFGMERLTLNNNMSDLSVIRQCLGYGIFRAAGSPAPRCNFATLTVNGELIGLYTNLEPIKKRFLARHFDDNDGDLYESSWTSDFRDEWMDSYEVKTTETDPERTRILAVTKAFEAQDDELIAALTPLVDLEAFAKFWALESLLAHGDGHSADTNNSFFYFEPEPGKMYGIPWGMDKCFIPAEWGMPPVFTTAILPNRLYQIPESRRLYYDALQAILDEVWDEAELTAEIDRMEDLLAPHVAADPWYATASDWSGNPAEFARLVQELRDYLPAKRTQMEEAIANPPTEVEPLATCDGDGGKP
ncbi:MAG: hypothetical protein GY854_28885 [Deltaproteobacteria bacterium]|nr:hypothetical protein [Deltaproteobacteria bacterium]